MNGVTWLYRFCFVLLAQEAPSTLATMVLYGEVVGTVGGQPITQRVQTL